MIFEDRKEAGNKLAEHLKQNDVEADIVLAVPPGGLPIGKQVANELKLPLDVITAGNICAPSDPERSIGAVTSDGKRWLNQEVVQELEIGDEYIQRKMEEQREKSLKNLKSLRGTEEPPEIEGKKVILVKDGIITGATSIACIKQLKSIGAEEVILAVPVGPHRNYEKPKEKADDVIIMETPRYFGPISAFYENFDKVSNKEAKNYITQQVPD